MVSLKYTTYKYVLHRNRIRLLWAIWWCNPRGMLSEYVTGSYLTCIRCSSRRISSATRWCAHYFLSTYRLSFVLMFNEIISLWYLSHGYMVKIDRYIYYTCKNVCIKCLGLLMTRRLTTLTRSFSGEVHS